jgi:iron complex outermembrane receptor protein
MRRLKAAAVHAALSIFCSLILLTTAYARADDAAPRPFDISPQSLATALSEFARQSQQEILFAPEVVAQKLSSGVRGTMEPLAALKLLLRDSALTFTTTAQGAVLVGKPPSGGITPLSSGEEKVLPNATGEDLSTGASSNKDQKVPRSFWERFRLAQVDQRKAADSATVSKESQSSDKNSQNRLQLEEIVVTAQKREEHLKDVPISISVLGGKDLDKSSFQGVTDALNTVPAVTAVPTYQGGGTQIVMRGVGAGGPLFNGSSPIAYYLDSAPFSLVKSAIVPDPDVYDLMRIEVLRGPQGTLYGANAQNGVVRVLTNDANLNDFEAKGRAVLSSTDGGGGNYRGDIAINVPVIEGKLAARAVADYEDLSGWVNSPIKRHINNGKLRNYRFKINAQPTEKLAVGLTAWQSRNDYGAPSASADNRRVSATLPQYIATDYDVYGLKIGYEFPNLSLSSMTSYLDYTNNGDFDLAPYGLPPGLSAFQAIKAHSFSQELILNSAKAGRWRWSAGAFYRMGTDGAVQKLNFLPTGSDISYTSKSYAAFGEIGQRFFRDEWEWTLGVRYFHDDVVVQENVQSLGLTGVPLLRTPASFNPTTPRAALTWYPHSDLTMYTSYSEGFRSGFPQDPLVVQIAPGIPAVKPDKLHNYEIGGKGDFFENRISFDTALYYIRWNDIQQQLLVPYAGLHTTALVNAQSASGVGLDFAVTTRPLAGLELGVSIGWNNLSFDNDVYSGGLPLFRKGDRPNYSSEYTGDARVDYNFPVGGSGIKGRFSASANYSSKQALHGLAGATTFIDSGDALLIARLGFSIISPDRWTSTAFVDNVNNTYAGSAPLTFPLPELRSRVRPRTVGVQFDYHL